MTDILDFPLFQFIGRFLSDFFAPVAGYLFTDTLTPYVGIRFVYLLMSMWLMWTVVNIFIIHPAPLGGLAADLADHEQRKQKAMLEAMEKKKREDEKSVTTRYERHPDGSVESWDK